ncbi:MAG: hypothetical protein F4X93_01470 [Proteobacteria bacterium]|nr:hypothetical protein [Pseudomonadota bacterium]
MEITLPALDIERKSGEECFRKDGSDLDFDLLDFWQWSMSDLVNNATRGVLAEYIVARALDVPVDKTRDFWAPYDLAVPGPDKVKTKVEVKSSSYVQSWGQSGFSSISFDISPSYAWDYETGEFDDEYKRQADVYVFALLAHKDKLTISPMNLDQWKFYVLSTAVLDEHLGDQKRIALGGVEKYASPISFKELKVAVSQAITTPLG